MPPPDRFRITLLHRTRVLGEDHIGTLAGVKRIVRAYRSKPQYRSTMDIWIVDEKTGTEYSVDPHGQLVEM